MDANTKHKRGQGIMTRRCSILYDAASEFIEKFQDGFIRGCLTKGDDIIDSDNTDYVIHLISDLYFRASTVTTVPTAKCTGLRKVVDRKVQALPRNPKDEYLSCAVANQLNSSRKPLPITLSASIESEYVNYCAPPSLPKSLARMFEEPWNSRFVK